MTRSWPFRLVDGHPEDDSCAYKSPEADSSRTDTSSDKTHNLPRYLAQPNNLLPQTTPM